MAVGNVEQALLAGDPTKPGSLYVYINRFKPNRFDAGRIGLPFELIRGHIGDRGRVEFHGMRASRKPKVKKLSASVYSRATRHSGRLFSSVI
jgi:hypothetical protein